MLHKPDISRVSDNLVEYALDQGGRSSTVMLLLVD
jgi:hypothetical protein